MKRFLTVLTGVWLLLGVLSWTQVAEAACERAYVYLLLDTSGSMRDTAFDSKHSDVRTAIKKLVNGFQKKLVFGLATFGAVYRQRVKISTSAWFTIATTVDFYPSNENYTRMGDAIYRSGLYLSNLKSKEPKATKDRPYYLVLITDGYPTSDPRNAENEARDLWKKHGIKTFVIGIKFNASLLNKIASQGQTGSAYNANNQSSITTAFNAIANTATKEVCDGLDNDCDGKIDEDFSPKVGTACTAGVGGCASSGSYTCRADKQGTVCTAKGGASKPETCNNKDDDCNGSVDEGLSRTCKTACGSGTETCKAGRWINCTAVKPQTEVCDGKDNDCDGKVDENWLAASGPAKGRSCSAGLGDCKRSGTWVCKADKTGIVCNAKAGPKRTEVCDGRDNDCDGKVDEDWRNKGTPCAAGSGTCKQKGTFVCKPDGSGVQCSAPGGNPSPEKCDNQDNDCNGKVDDNLARTCQTACGSGVESCKAGKWVGCTARQPSKEACDGQDNDCNGKVDDNLSRECKTKCGKGKEICVRARWDFCDAPKIKKEVCDNKDNDCNGKIDDLQPKPCNGACGKGEAVCKKGVWTGCSGPQPQQETCDGKDNDCDGKIDNDLRRDCKTACGGGKEICSNGTWSSCNAPLPQPEICNGQDDNCDGTPDDNPICPSGLVCDKGQCVRRCRNGECRQGFQCIKGLCVGDTCSAVTCPKGQSCLGGRCLDLCTLVQCKTGLQCSGGKCVPKDCYFTGCPTGKRCVNGLCEENPCKGVQCKAEEFCREGKCIPSCATVQCKDAEKCVDGKCVGDPGKSGPCSGVNCPAGQRCEKGKCIGDPCANVTCPQGRICKNGQCSHDPCSNIKCPAGQACTTGQCTKPPPPPAEKPVTEAPTNTEAPVVDDGGVQGSEHIDDLTGGGPNTSDDPGGIKKAPGCGCSTDWNGAPIAPIAFVVFALLLFIRRQR